MTNTRMRLADRYTIEERREVRGGPGECWLGTDHRLQRRVLVWTLVAPEGDPQRTAFLALARKSARLTQLAFLQVVDIVITPERVLAALELPGRSLQKRAPGASSRMAAELTVQVGEALEEAAHSGLHPQQPLRDHLYQNGADSLRLDPLGLFGVAGEKAAAPSIVPLLCDLLSFLLPSGAGELGPFLARWRRDLSQPDARLSNFLSELRGLVVMLPAPSGTALHPSLAADTTVLPTTARPAARSWRWRLVKPMALFASALLVGYACVAGVNFLSQTTNPGASSPTPTTVPANAATLTLAAQQDTLVRVTLDGEPAFTGVLQRGETRSWAGNQRVQVWTNGGKTLLVTVNGHALGPLSAAVGHPEWNTVDWGWPAGWRP